MKELQRLKIYLMLIGMKQVDLADKAGIHVCQVNMACNHNVASDRVRRRIAETLGILEEKLFPNGTRSY